jgi:hypothetical protein
MNSPLMTLPILFSQYPSQNFSRRTEGKVIDKLNGFRLLVAGQPLFLEFPSMMAGFVGK